MDGIARSATPERKASTGTDGGTHAAAPMPAPRRWGGLRMHHLLVLAFTLVTAIPLAVLAIWEGKTAFQNEMESVRERHLLVARNLTSTLSRYVMDLNSAFSLAFTDGALSPSNSGLGKLLTSLDVVHVCILNADGAVESIFPGLMDEPIRRRPDAERFKILRALADEKTDEPVLSKLYHDAIGRPVFYIVKALPGGRMGMGIVTTQYLVSLQQAIAFGDRGHAVLTDSKGQVIAHPLRDWVAASRDISGVPAVAAMMRGETGVGQFYSPAFNDTMIAGYAVVPETGWGVMVPQPITELRRRANQVNELAFVIAVAAFLAAALISYLIALWLTRPVRRVAATAEAVIAGNDHVSVPAPGLWAPSEIRSLGLAFNTMLEDLRRKAGETAQALRQAETSSKAKTQFLANMSHELRTPLNAVVGMMELMRLSGVSSTQQSYLEQANRSSQALLRMVNDVLDLSEMEVGKIALKSAPFRLDALIDAARAQCAEQAEDKKLTLSVLLPETAGMTLTGDKQRLLQILGNLLNNAIRFTESGGVAIRVSTVHETPATVHLRFEVGDTGIGVPAEMQERIFDAFTQGDSSMTRRHGGSGLGLAIVKELIQRMNGTFGVQSILGVGSTFWVSLPFDKSPATLEWVLPVQTPRPSPGTRSGTQSEARSGAHPEMLPVMEPPPGAAAPLAIVTRPRVASVAGRAFQDVLRQAGRTSFRILLVEDNSANLRVTQALLETLGCDVRTAVNGIEAVMAYREASYDLILMDCQMPEMDGYQATQAIRRIEMFDGRATPIVALTAHAMDGSRDQCLTAGMDDQLSKPLTLAALTRKLREWLTPARPVA